MWRQDGFTHLIFREGRNGLDCYVFPANADQFGPEERVDCVVALPLSSFSQAELDWAIHALANASHTVRVFNGRTFIRLAL